MNASWNFPREEVKRMSRLSHLFAGLVNVVTRNKTWSAKGPSVAFVLREGGGLEEFRRYGPTRVS